MAQIVLSRELDLSSLGKAISEIWYQLDIKPTIKGYTPSELTLGLEVDTKHLKVLLKQWGMYAEADEIRDALSEIFYTQAWGKQFNGFLRTLCILLAVDGSKITVNFVLKIPSKICEGVS